MRFSAVVLQAVAEGSRYDYGQFGSFAVCYRFPAVLCGCRKESGEVVQSKTRCETVTSSFYEADYSESWKVAELKLRYSGDNAQESAGQLS